MMPWFISAVLTGTIAFVATNIDDLVILMLFFAQVKANLRSYHILVGKYLGFTALVVVSLPGFFGGLLIPKAWIGLLGFLPIALGIHSLIKPEDGDDLQAVNLPSKLEEKASRSLINPQVLTVAAVTFANGGDNIGIYISLFASQTIASLGVILGVFFGLVGVWCWAASWLAKHRAIAPLLTRYSHILVPFVLIGLGIYILMENQSWQLMKG